MDQTSLARVLNLFSTQFLLFFLLPLIFFIILKHIRSPSSTSKSLPPGPKPWPIIGNILQMGNQPHISLENLAKIHGPLISLRLGTQLLIVGSSPEAAVAILKTHDRLLSARHIPKQLPYDSHVLNHIALVWSSECTERWKWLRALCKTELFSAKAMESHASLREKKIGEMMEFLGDREGEVVGIGKIVFNTVFNIISNLLFSKDLAGLEEKRVLASGLKSHMHKMMLLVTTPYIANFYPIFAGLDLQGLKRKLYNCLKEMFSVWEIDIKERRQSHVLDAPKRDFLDIFLANEFEDDQINWLALELFAAGADTTSATVEWAMAELLKNEEVMHKVREELEREISNSTIYESRVSQLRYVNACIKETLRLHPPAPFLVPHRAIETCEVMNYTIPKDSQVLVSVWAIGRDPSIWEDPLAFKPERFLDSNLDFEGNNYEFLPFGAGRRICPGLPLAAKQIPLILASLVHLFDWSLPNGKEVSKLDMNGKFGVVMQKEQPLLLVPNKRLQLQNWILSLKFKLLSHFLLHNMCDNFTSLIKPCWLINAESMQQP